MNANDHRDLSTKEQRLTTWLTGRHRIIFYIGWVGWGLFGLAVFAFEDLPKVMAVAALYAGLLAMSLMFLDLMIVLFPGPFMHRAWRRWRERH